MKNKTLFTFLILLMVNATCGKSIAIANDHGVREVSIRRTFSEKVARPTSVSRTSAAATTSRTNPTPRGSTILEPGDCSTCGTTLLGESGCDACKKPTNSTVLDAGDCSKCGKTFLGDSACDSCKKPAPSTVLKPGDCNKCGKTILSTKPCRQCPPPVVASRSCGSAPCSTFRNLCNRNDPRYPCYITGPQTPLASNDQGCGIIGRFGTLHDFTSTTYPCETLAPISLQWVDFRIDPDSNSQKLGNYRFRIFGCRREIRNVVLNQNRVLQNDLGLIDVFKNAVSDCYKVIDVPNDLCINPNQPSPEYILTAEITDFFMNVCDEHDWDKAKSKDQRNGSSQITITWRLMDLTKTEVLWKGTSVGFAELPEGRQDGEIYLLRAAFADAVDNLRQLPNFEQQLSLRLPSQALAHQRNLLAEIQRKTDPINCGDVERKPCIKKTTVKPSGTSITYSPMPEQPAVRYQDGSVVISLEEEGPNPDDLIITKEEAIEIKQVGVTTEEVEQVEKVTEEIIQTEDIIEVTEEVIEGEECINETSGVKSSGSSIVDEITEVSIARATPPTEYSDYGVTSVSSEEIETVETITEFDEDGNVVSVNTSCYETIDHLGTPTTVKIPCENKPVEASDFVSSSGEAIEEKSSATSDFEKSTAVTTIDFDTSNIECIVDTNPLTTLLPKDLATRRTAVVEITNQDNISVHGLLISDRFILTTADIVIKSKNQYTVRTSTSRLEARAYRINPDSNIALMVLKNRYNNVPVSYSLNLPEIGQKVFDLSMLDPDDDVNEANLKNRGTVKGYRYSEKFGAEIIVESTEKDIILGSVLINDKASVIGMAHSINSKPSDSADLFLPVESALKAIGMEICGKELNYKKAKTAVKSKPVTEAIKASSPKTPETQAIKKRK